MVLFAVVISAWREKLVLAPGSVEPFLREQVPIEFKALRDCKLDLSCCVAVGCSIPFGCLLFPSGERRMFANVFKEIELVRKSRMPVAQASFGCKGLAFVPFCKQPVWRSPMHVCKQVIRQRAQIGRRQHQAVSAVPNAHPRPRWCRGVCVVNCIPDPRQRIAAVNVHVVRGRVVGAAPHHVIFDQQRVL